MWFLMLVMFFSCMCFVLAIRVSIALYSYSLREIDFPPVGTILLHILWGFWWFSVMTFLYTLLG